MSARHLIVTTLLLAAATTASAIDLGSLKSAVGGADAGSLLSSNSGNVAGIVQFCVKNNVLGDDAVASVKDKLLGKFSLGGEDTPTPTEPSEDDVGYANGLKGLLSTKDGNSIDLSDRSDSLKEKLTEKACDVVLDQAKSLIGG